MLRMSKAGVAQHRVNQINIDLVKKAGSWNDTMKPAFRKSTLDAMEKGAQRGWHPSNRLGGWGRGVSKAAPWVAVGGAAYDLSQAQTNNEKAKAVASNGAARVGGTAGAEAGAAAGAAFGPVGAAVGGIAGGLFGGFCAAAAADTAIDKTIQD